MSEPGRIVRVAVPKPLPQLFDYALLPEQPLPRPGARLRVPFGRQQLTGVCVTVDPPDPHPDPRAVTAVLEVDNPFGSELLALALWIADYYHHPLGEVLGALMPAEVRRGVDLEAAYRPPQLQAWTLTEPRCRPIRGPRQQALFDYLQRRGGRATADELADAGFSRAVVSGAAAKGIVVRQTSPIARAVLDVSDRLTLNAEQEAVLGALRQHATGFSANLLQGVTGSGKTEIYLRLIESVLGRGLQVMVLVPEIALTPQTLQRFRRRFGAAAALHSGMTDAQRLQTWLGCRAGDIDILIGTRSAVLTPFRSLGLIVVDEEHDASFKQQDGLRYSARDVAVKRAQGLGIPLLLGSATPSFESLVNARTGRYRHLELQGRAGGASMPKFHLLDIRGHVLNDGVSNDLVHVMRRHLDSGAQVLLFLNRRGFAPSFLCSGCGWQASCPQCDLPMTLHRQPPVLVCHHCNHRSSIPQSCPACGSRALLGIGLGTQRTEAGVSALFPGFPVYRIDRDTARSQKRLEAQLNAIQTGRPAILIGTQMLAKGHHFPNVTLVGIINADGGFLSADFRAPERTAQLIVQVAGRAGRAERPGEVWIQTYQPENPALQSLIREGYGGFARRELAHRREAGLPPYRPMAMLRAEARDAAQARDFLERLQRPLREVAERGNDGPADGADNDATTPALEVFGPVAAPIQRVANRYRFQSMVIASSRKVLHDALRQVERELPAPGGLRWSLDIDPYDAF